MNRTSEQVPNKRKANQLQPKTHTDQEHLVHTSPWGDKGLEPIKPEWRRRKKRTGFGDGTTSWVVEELSDLQLTWLARCLTNNEKLRFDKIYKQVVLDPVEPAVEAITVMDNRLQGGTRGPGRQSGLTGETKLEIKLARVLIHRIYEIALKSLKHGRAWKNQQYDLIADQILQGVLIVVVMTSGALKDRIVNLASVLNSQIAKGLSPPKLRAFSTNPHELLQVEFRAAVKAAAARELRGDQSRAFWITMEIWSAVGEPISERHCRRILSSRKHFRIHPDTIR